MKPCIRRGVLCAALEQHRRRVKFETCSEAEQMAIEADEEAEAAFRLSSESADSFNWYSRA